MHLGMTDQFIMTHHSKAKKIAKAEFVCNADINGNASKSSED